MDDYLKTYTNNSATPTGDSSTMIYSRISARFTIAFLMGLLALSSSTRPAFAADESARPNIIFILTDDQRADAMGCMGNPVIETPELDKLASEGHLFKNAFCTTAICMTSRASFILGQYERRHHITSFRTPLTDEQINIAFPVLLREAGYYTGLVGKWGIGTKMPAEMFDDYRGFPGQGSYYPEGKKDQPGEHQTAKLAEKAVEFLEEVPTNRPFCLQIYTKAAHCQDQDHDDQFPADVKYDNQYADTVLPRSELLNEKYFQQLPDFLQNSESRTRWHRRFNTEEKWNESVKNYYRLVSGIDELLGKVRQQLEESGKADNSIIVFSSDHGFYLGERGLAGKWFIHEESIRIPMIIFDPRQPDSERGQVHDEMVLSIDVAPTIMDLAGVDAPATVQGRSLIPITKQEKVDWRHEFLYEHRFAHHAIPKSEGVRTEDWKYVRYIETEPVHEELYNLKQDPLEVNNLVNNPESQADLNTMRDKLKKLDKELQ
ncbi:Choline-sulfatase [Polystyrenella longa]|uniref:Choline-sulfatase n=1 Tax=Polystyrenella longa TaxID=2528007 RepID=A0A518CPC2_9PLAN|nr:sulfatase [Polystyrenella longa]QDU81075.1 Choline-sulfatase [Polystyrenella longa]